MIIGQTNVINILNKFDKNTFPRFSIVSGLRGSGKSLIIKYIADNILKTEINLVSSISDVRQICIDAPTFTSYRLYVLNDFDSMNFRAKESILKLCEDTPNNLYIIIETNSLENIKQTLISRANVIQLQNYSNDELSDYCHTLDDFKPEELEYLLAAFKTPGDILRAHNCGILELYSFCYKILTNIFSANMFNAMNISNKLKLKSDSQGYDLDLFFTILMHCAKFYLDMDSAENFINITSKTLTKLNNVKSLNKLMLFDAWLFEIRGVNFKWLNPVQK